jgi:hypothetical protein
MYMFCVLVGHNHSPIVDYKCSITRLTTKGYEQNVHTWLHVALTLISKQVHLLTTANAVNTVQFKVNGTDPHTAIVYLHIGLLQL